MTDSRGGDILARLEDNVARENREQGVPFVMAISFGVVRLETDETLEQLMQRAEGRMYESKNRRKGA